MSGFLPMFGKELRELVRTFRGPIVLVLFLIIGLGSPILAKVTPELLSSFASDELTGMELLMTRAPTALDALFQYQKNFALMPLVVILLGMGMVAGEKQRGTAALLAVKPLSRTAFVLAKFSAGALLYGVGTATSALGCLLYTTVLFGELDLWGFLLLNGLLYLGLLTYLAVTLVGSVLFRSVAAAAGFALGVFALLSTLGLLPTLARFSPAGLGNAVVDLVLGRETPGLPATVGVSAGLVLLLVLVAERLYARQEL